MKFTLSWLADHLDTTADTQTIANTLTHIGLEVETMEDKGAMLKPFVIGEVMECGKHPNADKLSLCKVSDGKQTFQVVCGAPNVRQGLKVVMAHVGDTIPRSGVILNEGVIRGMASQAMLCSNYELCLGDDHDGIIELPKDAPMGKNYAAWASLNDVMFDIKLTPNRGDCLGVRGIARDLAAAGLGTLKPLNVKSIAGGFPSPLLWKIESAAAEACPLVMGRYFKGVKNCPSPAWLKAKLASVGMKSISALVDITNYLSQDLARPLHVFSAKKLKPGDITMRYAKQGEKILALDEKEYSLDDKMLVIDNAGAVASVGGIMGGLASGCQLDDTDIFLEVAYFEPTGIARTGRLLNLLSDARYRFERGIDPEGLQLGLDRATQLILEICGGEASTITTAGKKLPPQKPIDFSPAKVKTYGGLTLGDDVIEKKLTALGFVINKGNPTWQVIAPSWRRDIENDNCLVEEVLRLHGFDKIPDVALPRLMPHQAINEQGRRLMTMRRALAQCGFYETITWSFTKESLATDFGGSPALEIIKLQNPIHSDMDCMRPSVLCNLILAAGYNQARNLSPIYLFESGLAFHGVEPEQQVPMIAGIKLSADEQHWQKLPPLDAFVIKSDMFAAIESVGFNPHNLQIKQDNIPPHYHPHAAASLNLGKDIVGYFGELHPAVLARHGVTGKLFGFEIFMDKIPVAHEAKSRAKPPLIVNDLPRVHRDFAFLVDKNITAAQIVNAIKKADKKFIDNVRIFDIYQDIKHPSQTSIALRVTIIPDGKTLSDIEIKTISDKIVAEVLRATNGQLRQ